MRTVFALILGLLIGAGGAWLALRREPPKAEAPHEEEHGGQVTVWSDRHEIFLEHPMLIAGEPATFVTHVTELSGPAPKTAGPIVFVLRKESGAPIEVSSSAPARPGIYTPSITFPGAGDWSVALRVDEANIDLGTVEVHASRDEAHVHPPAETGGIRFLKEQQWKLGTKVEPVVRRGLVQRLRVPGVVTARAGARTALTPPVEGRLLPFQGGDLPSAGDRVKAGQVLAFIQAPFSEFTSKYVEAEADSIRTQVALEQAAAAEERIRKLVEQEARPVRELRDAEFALRAARAAHDTSRALRAAYAKSGATILEDGTPAFELRSPIAGVVVRVAAAPGEFVHAEQPVITILDASRVWVEARVSEADLNRLTGTAAALYETPDAPGRTVDTGAPPVFRSPEVDPATRTVTLTYDVANPDGALRLGMALTMHVETARAEEALAIPVSALVDEEGRFVAYVQTSGETFEKRDLTLGIRDAGFAQVVSGLEARDRVVTKGAYAVKLASASTAIAAHGHEH